MTMITCAYMTRKKVISTTNWLRFHVQRVLDDTLMVNVCKVNDGLLEFDQTKQKYMRSHIYHT